MKYLRLFLPLLLFTYSLSAKSPNILLILVDDLKPALGCYGDDLAKTPNIDALAERGTRFELAYCNQAVCAPSRFTLMLGAHSTSTGLYGLGSHLRKVIPNAVTMPQHFAKHGYRTESLGKIFHIGHGNHGDPESFSVPHFKEKVIEYADPVSKPEGKITREEAMFQNVRAPKGGYNALHRGAAYEWPDVKDDAYADGRVAAETVRRLEDAKKRDKPFFIAAGFARPHLPFSAPKKYWDLFDPEDFTLAPNPDLPKNSPPVAHKRGGEIRNYFPVPDKTDPAQISDEVARKLIHGYYASTSYVDAQIGKVLKGLKRLRLEENTLVVLWGDHGFHLGDLGIWTKHTNYEQANRIPLLFAGPGVPAGQSTRQLAESVDVFPTLSELAGIPSPDVPQPIDGLSLVPVLRDPCKRVRDHAFHAYPRRKMGRAIRTERYRLVEWKSSGEPEYELYDYESDPLEAKNLVASKPDVVNQLKSILATYPEPAPYGGWKNKKSAQTSPKIANKTLTITAEVELPAKPPAQGVVLAQGGDQQGYALHFIKGKPAFDVRVNSKVTRILSPNPQTGKILLKASLGSKSMRLSVNNGTPITIESPGLIPVQPLDSLSVGLDSLTAAGNYQSPNPFNGKVVSHVVASTAFPNNKKELPNIVLFLSDDLGLAETSVYGSKEVRTPNMARLAKQGMTFEKAYVASPSCCPNRYSLLTGLMPARHGAHPNHTFPKKDTKYLVPKLKEMGYHVASFGKIAHRRDGQVGGYFNSQHREKMSEHVKQYFAENDIKGPICLMVGDRRPHVSWTKEMLYDPDKLTLPSYFIDTPETREHWARYCSDITGMDEELGRVLDFSKKHLGENVITMFSSDHGGQWHRSKWTLYDAGTRIPLMVSWPGYIHKSTRTEAMVSWVDLIPTLIDLVGGEVPEDIDGKSFGDVLIGKKKMHRDRIFTTHTGDGVMNIYPIRAVTDGNYKYIHNLRPDAWFTNHSDRLRKDGAGAFWDSWEAAAKKDPNAQAVVNAYYTRPEFEFFDLKADPLELNNLANSPEHQKILKKLRAELSAWTKSQGDDLKPHKEPYLRTQPIPVIKIPKRPKVPKKPKGPKK